MKRTYDVEVLDPASGCNHSQYFRFDTQEEMWWFVFMAEKADGIEVISMALLEEEE